MLKTGSEIAKLKGVSKQAVNDYIRKNTIQPAGKKGNYPTYDCSKKPLSSYLAAASPSAKNQKPPEPPKTPTASASPPSPPQAAEEAVRRISKPLNRFLAGQMEPGDKPAEYLFGKALELAQTNRDATLYFKLGQIATKEENDETIRLQALETEKAKEQIARGRAERIKLENSIRRGQYMDKAVIKLIFGKQYAIDTSVLIPLGLKLADMINALPPSPDRRKKIQELIDDEVFAALESKKRILADFIGFEGEPVDKSA